MPLANGTQLGPYEIVAPIGAGGMGEVFRARDTRLGRDGKILYGLRGAEGKNYLSTIDVESGKEKNSRELADLKVGSPLNPAILLSLSADGKRLATTAVKVRSDIWVMEGFEPPGLLERLGLKKT